MTPKEFSLALQNDPESAINAVGEGRFDANSSNEGLPALMEAIASNETGIVHLLIARGARVDDYARAPSPMQGLAAIHVASTATLVNALVDAGAFVDAPIREIDRAWGMREETALHCAALYADIKLAGALLNQGANPNLPFNTSGQTTSTDVLDVRSNQTLVARLAQFKLVDAARRDHNQIALETVAQPVRVAIPMTAEGMAHMRLAIETHVRSQKAVDNMSYQLKNPPVEASHVEKSARIFGGLVRSFVDDVKFMAVAIKTRVQYDALSPQTSQQKTASVLSAINDGTAMIMADAKRNIQTYREQVAELQSSGSTFSPR